MARRNTRTGDVQEQMVIPALTLGGYRSRREVKLVLASVLGNTVLMFLQFGRMEVKF